MARILQIVLLSILLSASPQAFSQGTFQKFFPGLMNSMGSAHALPSGGVTFSAWAIDQFGASAEDLALVSLSGEGDTLWTRIYGRPYTDHSYSSLATTDGGYLIVGNTANSDSTNGGYKLYLIRTDAVGDTIWTRAYSGVGTSLSAIECIGGGFLLVSSPLHIMRINEQGDLLWSRMHDRHDPPFFESQVYARGICQSADSNFFAIGSSAAGAFLSKIDPSGNVLWTRTVGGGSEQILFQQIVPASDMGFIVLGHFGINEDYLVIKLDASGDPSWSKAYGSSAGEWPYSIQGTSDGGVVITGVTQRPDPSGSDVYFIKTDSTGTVQFSKTFGDSEWDAGRSVAEADDGGYFIVAWTQSFGSGSSMYVIKIDSTGTGDCYQDSVPTIETDVVLDWQPLQLQPYSSDIVEYSGACSVRSGVSFLPLCPVGVSEVGPQEQSIHVFPNPATDRFTVAFPLGSAQSQIEIFNALGVRAMTIRTDSAQTSIDCSSFSRGIYLVKVTTPTTTITQRVVLE